MRYTFRYPIFLLLAIALFFPSCVQQLEEREEPQERSFHTVHFSATATEAAGTKATLNEHEFYVFEKTDRLFVIDEAHASDPAHAVLYGFLHLVSGEGDTIALFDGDLLVFDTNPSSTSYKEPQTPSDGLSLVATLVSEYDELHKYITPDKTNKNGKLDYSTWGAGVPTYPTDKVAVEDANGTAFQNAVRQFSHFTGTAPYGNPSFTLSQHSSFILFSITFDDDEHSGIYMPNNVTVDISLSNGGSTRTGTIVTSKYGGSFVQAHFAMAFPAGTQLSGASLTLSEQGGTNSYSEPSISNVRLEANHYYNVTRMVTDNDFCIRPNAATTITFNYPVQVKTGIAPYADFADCTSISLSQDQTVKVRAVGLKYNSSCGALFSSSSGSAKCYIYGDIMSLAFTDNGYSVKKPTADDHAFEKLFAGATYIDIPEGRPLYMAADTGEGCYKEMFLNCTSLTQAPQFYDPADNTKFSASIAESACEGMFQGCTNLTAAPDLLATEIGTSGYKNMFKGCKNLMTVPELGARKISASSYQGMFEGCEQIISAPALPADQLVNPLGNANNCYNSMFKDCINLVNGPSALPMATLYEGCFESMFSGCKKLLNAPEFPSTSMASAPRCFYGMFRNCEVLKTVPTGWSLPITDIKASSCQEMFKGCYALATVPTLSSLSSETAIAGSGCLEMFSGCREIDDASSIDFSKVTKVDASACQSMFQDCVKLETAPASLPATTLAASCYQAMFKGCIRLKTAPPIAATTLEDMSCKQMFKGCAALEVAPAMTVTTLNGTENCYEMFGGEITINGFNYSVTNGCAKLKNISNIQLNATTLTTACYHSMFMGSAITSVPDDFLPADNLAVACYMQMFLACKQLTHVPSGLLPASELKNGCYANMFRGCSELVDPPDLLAVTPVPACYFGMFRECAKLTGIKCLIVLETSQQDKARPNSITDVAFPTPSVVAAWEVTSAWTVFNKWIYNAKNVNTGTGLEYNATMPTPDNVYTGDDVGRVPVNWKRTGVAAQ